MTEFVLKKDEQREITLTEPGEYRVILAGEGASATVVGAFRAGGTDRVTVKVIIHHQARHTSAMTTLKGVTRDSSSITFAGRIIIDHDCGASSSFLTERILLLSEKARAEAIPDLEILTDDVKCSHAASISSIPEPQLFYLQSRGIPLQEAEELIVAGFLQNLSQ